MVGEIYGALSGLKTAVDIAKSLKDMTDAAARASASVELLEKLLAAQETQLALLERIRNLEAKLAAAEGWEAEKQRYELVEITPGALAYAVKEAVRGSEPPHHLCATCYAVGKKSFLQQRKSSFATHYHCLHCKIDINV